jgi:vitamin B12 transporter
MYTRCTFAAGTLALLAALPSIAAETETAAVVVTATRQAQRANELLADVSVISREEIDAAGQTSLPELLARQPGVEYTASGGAGSSMGLLIRGANSEHTLVLIDGMRVNSATLGTTSLSRIPLSQIDHIEILRGPASALYGSEAIGGVVQIFTKQGDGPAAFNAEAAYGTYDTSRLSAGVSGQNNGLKYSLQASFDNTGGFSNISNNKSSAYNPDKDGFRNSSFSGNLAYRFNSNHEIGLNTLVSDGRNRYDGGYSATTAAIDYRNDIAVSSYSLYSRNQILPMWKSTIRMGRGTDDASYASNGVQTSFVRTDQDQVAWQNDIKLPLGNALLAAEWLKQRLSASQAFSQMERSINSVLGGWSAAAGAHRWQVNARHDDISQTGAKNTGSLAYGYQITDAVRANASMGTAYKAPSMNDLYFPNTPFVGRGNPNLKPELARNREVSLHYETARDHASVTYFNNRITDLIQWSEAPPAGSYFYVPQNVAAAKITGWTLAYKGSFGPLALRSSLDLQDPRDTGTGLLLARRARQRASVGADYITGVWTLGGELSANGERYSDSANLQRMGGYTLANLSVLYRLDRDVSLFGRINNLFDKKYELVTDYGVPGINALVGIRYQPK